VNHCRTATGGRGRNVGYDILIKGGTVVDMNLSNGGVSLTDFSVMKQALGDRFPADLQQTVEEYTAKVRNGEIVVQGMEGF